MSETVAITYGQVNGTYGVTASVPAGATFRWVDESGNTLSLDKTIYVSVKDSGKKVNLVGSSGNNSFSLSVDLAMVEKRLLASKSSWVWRSHSNDLVDANSATFVSQLKTSLMTYGKPAIALNIKDYSYSMFYADASTPRGTIYVTDPWYSSKVKSQYIPQGYEKLSDGRYGYSDVALPNGLDGAPGSDGSFVIHDPVRKEVIEGWQLRRNEAGELVTTQAGRQSNPESWDGRWYPGLGVAGAGASMSSTCLSMADFDKALTTGRFDRAIYFAVPPQYVKQGVFRYPATRTDGWEPQYSWLEEGMRFILPTSFDAEGYIAGHPELTKFCAAMIRTLSDGHPLVLLDRCGPVSGAISLESYTSLMKTQPERFKSYEDVYAGYARMFGSKTNWVQFDGFPWDALVCISADVKN